MRKFAKIGPILMLLVSSAVLRADTTPTTPATPPAAAPGPALTLLGDAKARATVLEKQIETDARTVLHLKEQARKAKDVIKLSCINDRLVQVKAQLNLADTNRDDLRDALEQDMKARHELLFAYEQHANAIARLKEEAVACVGEPELYKQESGNTVDHPPIPDDPLKDQSVHEIEPPGYASPYS